MFPRIAGAIAAPLQALAAALVLALAVPAGAQPAGHTRQWRFAVSLDAIPVGEHRYVVVDDGAVRRVTAEARFRVHLLVVDAYAWEQHVDETWKGDCLASLSTRTVEQGRVSTVVGHADGGAFVVQGPAGDEALPGCQMTFAYWNPHVLERHVLINTQTGAATPVSVENLGRDTYRVRGTATGTQHWRIRTPRNTIELWYADDGDWVGMRTTTRDGHVLAYRLV